MSFTSKTKMSEYIASQQATRYMQEKYKQVFELVTRDYQKEIDGFIKKYLPKSRKRIKCEYAIEIKPLIEIRRIK